MLTHATYHINSCVQRVIDHSNTWMVQTRTDGPEEFEPSKFDCIKIDG